ncbi:DUF2249 domain-containing protein [Nonomuraea mesophila]|uniref:DUF2249 domain-containing protein n=1 Tax=Nonomuraea mesophila TaxID=2530382 RepID=A0A4R5E9T9_9ACTN|nr:DUF2249 domain-containing protein [Nonomuraea mesophila]TDE28985.1 DUF2249 domain-containing protein [Nonomuraea mesophila]
MDTGTTLPLGERLNLCARTDPAALCAALAAGDPDLGFAYLDCGPDRWRVRVTRRPGR